MTYSLGVTWAQTNRMQSCCDDIIFSSFITMKTCPLLILVNTI